MVVIVNELSWLRNLFSSLGVTIQGLMSLQRDNQAALHIATNPVFHEMIKYIEIDCHFVYEHIKFGAISTYHVLTPLQLTNIFTKALGQDHCGFILNRLGVRNPCAPT